MKLRPAVPEDLELLRDWDGRPHVIAATGPNSDFEWETELGREVAWREFLIGEVAGRPIGVLQIIDPALEESHYWGEIENDLRAVDIWIGEEDYLGRGFGTRMMQLCLERCFDDPNVKAVLVDPLAGNQRAHRFYERQGFKAIERRWFGDDDCIVYRVDRDDWCAARSGTDKQ